MAKPPIPKALKRKFTSKEISDKELLSILRKKKKFACKPCWELKYCPYGPIVEDYPTHGFNLEEMTKMIEHHKEALKTSVALFGRRGVPFVGNKKGFRILKALSVLSFATWVSLRSPFRT